ncbi:DUF4019 domain-containing protein [Mucilaginibacter sp. CAU 1740]|uniref:DUF4019 domain-containing protein n=1 Tax=Mucilaginibacter sp. CAU 1740 TaxID=3140365 RepID=UPI00325BC680
MRTFKFFKSICLAILACLITLSGCKFNSTYINREDDKQAAEKVTNKFFELIKAKKYNDTFKLYSDKFWTVTPKSKMLEIYTMSEKKLGELNSATVDNWETRRVEGSDPSAEYVFAYKTKHSKYQAVESIRLMREKDGSIKIVAYNVNSEGLFK